MGRVKGLVELVKTRKFWITDDSLAVIGLTVAGIVMWILVGLVAIWLMGWPPPCWIFTGWHS